jgi:cytoskeletal protein CcmA (bactofilin family)
MTESAPTRRPLHRDQRGIALIMTLLLLTVLLTLGAFALQFSGFEMKIANNFATGTQALQVAESGLLHALSTMNHVGVTDFNHDIVQRWGTLFTPNPKSVAGYSGLTYQVSVVVGADAMNTGTITVTAFGNSGAQRVVVARVLRGTSPDGRGALYLAADSVSPSFNGSAFEIDGNDHDLAGRLVANGLVKPGIADRNDAVTNAVKSGLSTNQIPAVQGLGYSASPPNPSVITSGGPGINDMNQIISDLLSRPGVQTVNDTNIAGGTTFGDVNSPQITHLTAGNVNLVGHVSGAGILIADGSIKISGNTDFIGWIIVRGETIINATASDETTVLGNATILGSLWTGDINITVGGSAIIDYSTTALQLADQVVGGGSPVPKPMTIIAWREVF